MTRSELLLLTINQLTDMIIKWPEAHGYGARIRPRTELNVGWKNFHVQVAQWGGKRSPGQFSCMVRHTIIVRYFRDLLPQLKDWSAQPTAHGFRFTPPAELMPKALLVVVILALTELQERQGNLGTDPGVQYQ